MSDQDHANSKHKHPGHSHADHAVPGSSRASAATPNWIRQATTLAWPALLRLLAVLPVIALLWALVLWANADSPTW